MNLKKLLKWLRPPRKLRPTRDGLFFLGATLAVGFAAVNTGNNLLFFILGLLLAAIVVSGILSEQNLRSLKISRELPSGVHAGEDLVLRLVAKNTKSWLPTVGVMVRDLDVRPRADPAWIGVAASGGGIGRGRTPVSFPQRGRRSLARLELSTTWPFGLFRKSREIDVPDEVLVWPRRVEPPSAVWQGASDRGQKPRTRRGEGFELFGLHTYQPGEDARRIHWKASARAGRPIARENSDEESREIMLFVDEHREGERFETAIERTAALAELLLELGHRVGVIAGDTTTSPESGPGARRAILDTLALAVASRTPLPAVAGDVMLLHVGGDS